MQNLDTSKAIKPSIPSASHIRPTLIPITAQLLTDQHISTYVYHVAPADVLAISVWQHPEFNPLNLAARHAGYLVDAQGDIYFPLVGYVHVAGKTVDAIRVAMTSRLRKYIQNPQLNIRVADFRGQKIYALGELMKPPMINVYSFPQLRTFNHEVGEIFKYPFVFQGMINHT